MTSSSQSRTTEEPSSLKTRLKEEAIGGLSAGLLGTVIGFPLDLIKTRMQTSKAGGGGSRRPRNTGVLSTGYSIVKNESFLALYKGIGPPLISLSILNTITFASYSYFRKLYNCDYNKTWEIKNALAGSTCGIISGTVSTVENRLKTEMQMDNITNKRYKGSYHCFLTLVKEKEGGNFFTTIYKGHTINTVREMLFLSTYFYMYEGLRHIMVGTIAASSTTNESSSSSHKWAVPIVGGMAGATAWFISFPLDCIRAQIQGPHCKSKILPVFQELIQTKGIRGLYSGVVPSILRAFLVSGSRFSAYETALYFLRGGRDA